MVGTVRGRNRNHRAGHLTAMWFQATSINSSESQFLNHNIYFRTVVKNKCHICERLAFHKWYFNRKLLLLSTTSLHFIFFSITCIIHSEIFSVTKARKSPGLPFYHFRLSKLDKIIASKSEMPHGERIPCEQERKKKYAFTDVMGCN